MHEKGGSLLYYWTHFMLSLSHHVIAAADLLSIHSIMKRKTRSHQIGLHIFRKEIEIS